MNPADKAGLFLVALAGLALLYAAYESHRLKVLLRQAPTSRSPNERLREVLSSWDREDESREPDTDDTNPFESREVNKIKVEVCVLDDGAERFVLSTFWSAVPEVGEPVCHDGQIYLMGRREWTIATGRDQGQLGAKVVLFRNGAPGIEVT